LRAEQRWRAGYCWKKTGKISLCKNGIIRTFVFVSSFGFYRKKPYRFDKIRMSEQ